MAPPTGPTPSVRASVPSPLARELDEVLDVRGAQREEKLLASKSLDRLVPLMPPEELFFTLKEMEESHVPLVLAHAEPQQVQFLLDLELWKKDRLRPDRLAHWMNFLAECGDEAMGRWLRRIDLSTWTLLLGSVARIRAAEEDADPLQEAPGAPPFTLDGVYYVSARPGMEDLIRDALTAIRDESPDLYFRLVESLSRDVDSPTGRRPTRSTPGFRPRAWTPCPAALHAPPNPASPPRSPRATRCPRAQPCRTSSSAPWGGSKGRPRWRKCGPTSPG
jgi:hypothetical protein